MWGCSCSACIVVDGLIPRENFYFSSCGMYELKQHMNPYIRWIQYEFIYFCTLNVWIHTNMNSYNIWIHMKISSDFRCFYSITSTQVGSQPCHFLRVWGYHRLWSIKNAFICRHIQLEDQFPGLSHLPCLGWYLGLLSLFQNSSWFNRSLRFFSQWPIFLVNESCLWFQHIRKLVGTVLTRHL